ncbi:28S ribosomal protein S25 [Acropora cervicornis]|uniref:28S ribosomal protein S25 n=1 Tax=Acropora cervicornis TaxID=6130 RepID=A0AAD9UXW7_ACRCE|nr:28S ribosomal protein S25 [Acropora cervicornis]
MADKCKLLHYAAKRYLVSKATNQKIGKFPVQRTLEHLQRCNVVLNQDVKQMKINLLQPIDQFNNGAHRFFWENFPQLKYKNPQVKFCRSEKKTKAEDILVEFVDGRMETISTRQKSPSQIMQEVINIATLPDTRPDNVADDVSMTREKETS